MRRQTAAARSALFFAVAPGVVAGVVPWLLTGWSPRGPWSRLVPIRIAGGLLALTAAVVLVQAFARFAREGLGTPAPIAPTEHLVVGGLYRYVRNPMYLAVTATIVGQALLLLQPVLFAYAALEWIVTAAFARGYEEPALVRQFGAGYESYRRAVPAWWPRRPTRGR